MSGALEPLSISATGAAADAIARHVPDLVGDKFASRLFGKDASLWGEEAESEAGDPPRLDRPAPHVAPAPRRDRRAARGAP